MKWPLEKWVRRPPWKSNRSDGKGEMSKIDQKGSIFRTSIIFASVIAFHCILPSGCFVFSFFSIYLLRMLKIDIFGAKSFSESVSINFDEFSLKFSWKISYSFQKSVLCAISRTNCCGDAQLHTFGLSAAFKLLPETPE